MTCIGRCCYHNNFKGLYTEVCDDCMVGIGMCGERIRNNKEEPEEEIIIPTSGCGFKNMNFCPLRHMGELVYSRQRRVSSGS